MDIAIAAATGCLPRSARCGCRSGGEAQAPLPQADVAAAGQHQVVQHLDAQQLPRHHHLTGHLHVLAAGLRVARGVVVHHHDGRAALPHRLAEDVGHPHLGAVDGALVDLGHPQHVVAGVEEDDPQVLLLQQGHIGQEQVGHVAGGADDGALLGGAGQQSPAQLQGRLHLGGLGLAHAVLGAQLPEGGPRQPRQSAPAGQQPRGQGDGALPPRPHPQDDGQQFGVGEAARPVLAQPLARALAGGQVADAQAVFRPRHGLLRDLETVAGPDGRVVEVNVVPEGDGLGLLEGADAGPRVAFRDAQEGVAGLDLVVHEVGQGRRRRGRRRRRGGGGRGDDGGRGRRAFADGRRWRTHLPGEGLARLRLPRQRGRPHQQPDGDARPHQQRQQGAPVGEAGGGGPQGAEAVATEGTRASPVGLTVGAVAADAAPLRRPPAGVALHRSEGV